MGINYDAKVTLKMETELKELGIHPPFSENALKILEKRYLMKDDDNNVIETPMDMLARVSANIAYADTYYGASYEEAFEFAKTIYAMMANLEFLPNSPALRGAGRETQQLSACFVLPIEDSRKSIFGTLRDAVDIQAYGGGTGFNFSNIRAKGTKVGSTGGAASGPISFMQIYDMAVGKVIAQGGVRQGANMGILVYNHPDVLDFIDAKKDGKTLSNFNISVGVDEKFMQLAEKGLDYDLVDPHTKQITRKANAKEVFDKIAHNAWDTGDPGLIFLDRINLANPTPHLGKIESTNPCGELPLLPWESCNLGSINLLRIIQEDKGKYSMDYNKLAQIVRDAVHFLDNVIDMNKYPIEKIEEMTKATRKIGLGVMGWADMLAILNIPYDSDEALGLADKVMGFINTRAKEASVELAKVRGVFPSFKGSIHDTGKEEDMVRHSSWTTIAPTGTLSTLSDCNGGIEPFFMIVYSRGSIYDSNGNPTVKMLVENGVFKKIAIEQGFYSEELMAKIAETGSVQHVDGVPDQVKRCFVTSHDISYEWHLKMQSAFQKHVTNAVSKTINFPNEATVDDIKASYVQAYKLGNIKGITVYRDGCKQNQVLSAVETVETKEKESAEITSEQELQYIMDKLNAPRPRKIAGTTDRIETPVGKLYVTINKANGKFYEVFLNIGKAGADVTADAEGYGRLLSMLFKIGVPAEIISEQLRGIGGSGSIGFGKERVRSLPDGIARVLEIFVEENSNEYNPELSSNNSGPKMSGNMCPECGNMLIFEEGCTKCRNCGYSRC